MDSTLNPARQLPNQKGFDVSKNDLSGLSLFPRPRNIIENPTNLETAEISGKRKSSFLAKAILPTITRKFRDCVFHASVLPDQRVVHRPARLAIPDDGRFSLVGDPD